MADGAVPITAGSGTNIRAVTNAAVQGGAYQQVMSLAGPDGTFAPFDPDGTMQVSPDSKALFLDAFDVSLANFTTGGTAPTISSGMATFASTTTASTSSYLRSVGTFLLRPQAYLRAGFFVQLGETTSAITNNSRWWGYGQIQATPTATAPVLNGAVFLIDYADGALKAAVYSAGTRTQVVTITRPADGALHKYEIWWRQAVVYFVIDGVTVTSITYPNTAVTSGMYLIAGSVNHTSAPGTAPVLRLSSASMADTSGTNSTLSDGVNPWIQASVRPISSPAAYNTDSALVVVLRDSPTVTIGGIPSAYASTTSAAFFSGVMKSSGGYLQELTVSNPTTTAAFVKLYNATSVTGGTTAAIAEYRLAASGSAGDTLQIPFGPQGKRFTTGIAIGVSGAVGATNNSATVAGIYIHATYF